MGWAHPTVTLEEFVGQVGAFLDILILASGYQSDGSYVFWKPQTVRNALGWARYLEQVLEKLPVGQDGEASKRELDSALGALLAIAPLPQRTPEISSTSLADARRLLIQVLVQALHAKNALVAVAVVKDDDAAGKNGLFELVVEEMMRRCLAGSQVDFLQQALDVTMQALTVTKDVIPEANIWWKNQSTPVRTGDDGRAPVGSVCSVEGWIEQSLAYITSADTVRKLSGSTLIFSASTAHWAHVLDSLQGLSVHPEKRDNVVEVVELCCLFLASSGWMDLPHKLLSTCCYKTSTLLGFSELNCCRNCLVGKGSRESTRKSEHIYLTYGKEVENYLQVLIHGDNDVLWKLPPILLAAALSEGDLLKFYVQQLDRRAVEVSKHCTANHNCEPCKPHADVAERVWCLLAQGEDYGADMTKQLLDIFVTITRRQ